MGAERSEAVLNPLVDVALAGVTKRYGATVALDDVTLEVREGEFFTLLGPSGCGKTTALRSIAGFVTPDAGEVFLKGDRVTALPPHRRRVGMVFQHYALFPHRTVAQNVAFGLRMQKAPREEIGRRVTAALEQVRLPGHGARFPRQLSGGEQQRVALARALVTQPAVLLLDEPLGALDKKLREHMQVELKRLQREVGVTTVYVTHDQEEALAMSDRVAVLRSGRVQQVGTPVEIYERPLSAFVADFIGNTNLLPGRVLAAGAGEATLECRGQKLRAAASTPVTGEDGVLAVRPEKLELTPAEGAPSGGMENDLPAVVIHVVYLGETVLFHLRSDDGIELQALELAPGGGARYPVGTRVRVGWRAADARVLTP